MNANSGNTKRRSLALRERIPLNLSTVVENPNYAAEREALFVSGIKLLYFYYFFITVYFYYFYIYNYIIKYYYIL